MITDLATQIPLLKLRNSLPSLGSACACDNKDYPHVTGRRSSVCGSKTTLTSSKGHRASLAQLQNHLPKHRISTSKPLIATSLSPTSSFPQPQFSSSCIQLLSWMQSMLPCAGGQSLLPRDPSGASSPLWQVPAPASTLLTRASSTCRRVMSWPEQTGDVMARAARRHPLSNLNLPPAWQSCSLSSRPPGTRGLWHSPILIPPLVRGGGRGAGAYTGCCQDFSRQAK